MSARPPSLLLVCMGNICRSPLAEGIFRHRAAETGLELELDSAGTHAYHIGHPPDARARRVARERGLSIDTLSARQVVAADFQRFDHILVADRMNLDELNRRFPRHADRAQLLLAFCGISPETEVPDPYYGEYADFESVFELLDRAARGALTRLRKG
ncbi:low molecular weight protein-tyrosine-phosphatase [Pseudomarimonas salicorniae]|uniref:protein-tyrosine-phosphatase n=1 Tax=Pseudomarimonas salicorniae TaxID=2933270 RepID=A0ABT0GFJ6_9GAMM|nr:low molecular weight protein-tyrosine-phosphatase [Lysobacter sp. CAU 1642]MCK7592964.1 low molecular weight phosphotyrosine protein phosphatase [Lysobacter sp. CAU 1642]